MWTNTGKHRPAFAHTPNPGQESVWDYPRPPALVTCERQVSVLIDGITLTDTSGTLRLLETASPPTYYIPPGDVNLQLLTASGPAARPLKTGPDQMHSVKPMPGRVKPPRESTPGRPNWNSLSQLSELR